MITDARDLLRDFWRSGVRVSLMPDRFRLDPPGVAVEPLRLALREYAAEVKALLAELPAPDRCQICGGATTTGRPNIGLIHCGACARIAVTRSGPLPRVARGAGNPHQVPDFYPASEEDAA